MKTDDFLKKIKKLDVFYHDKLVGTLAETRDFRIAFEYDADWIEHGFSISPFSLPLREGVFLPDKTYFDGLFGVFADSLPDAWGRLLHDRYLRSKGYSNISINALRRLALVGKHGIGALEYRPSIEVLTAEQKSNLDELAIECKNILKSNADSDDLDEIYLLGGSSGGTRPKVYLDVDGEEWLIKFPSHIDSADMGIMEYNYAECARACGIEVAETRLFSSSICGGYFGSKRFDRDSQGRRIHMISAAGLLELDYEQPSLDYAELIKLVRIMTEESESAILQMYRIMCFNVYAHNQDDHTKNFSFLYDEESDKWYLAPAYDLTYSTTYYNEHTTSVAGNGKDPSGEDVLRVAIKSGIDERKAIAIKDEIKELVGEMLIKPNP